MSNKYDCYSSYSWRNYEVTSGVCPGDLFLRKSVGKYLIESPCGDICHEKTLTKMSCPKAICFGGESPQDTAFILKILCERYAIKQSVKGNCLPNKVRMEISSKQIPKETSTKEYLEKPAYQKKTKRNLYEKNLKGKLSPPKIKQSLYQQLCQGLPRKLWRDIPCKIKIWNKNLSKHLSQETFPYQANWRNVSTKRASEEKSLPKRMKKHLQKIREKKHNK